MATTRALRSQDGLRVERVVDKQLQVKARPTHTGPQVECVYRGIHSPAPRKIERRRGIVPDEWTRIATVENIFAPKGDGNAVDRTHSVFERRRHVPG